jgi:large subunit ribosomal protein L25
MKKHILEAQKRTLTGRKVRRLRKEGVLPATLYGKNLASQNVQTSEELFLPIYKEVGETGLIELMLEGKKHAVLISNIQVHPVTGSAIHIDFREVDLTEKVKAAVPVVLVGESPAEKQGIGTAVLMVSEIEVEALPGDLPESFVVDATILTEVDQVFTVSDLNYDKSKIEVQSEADLVLAKVEPPQKEEEIATPTETIVEGEAAKEGDTSTSSESTSEDKKSE